MTGAILKAGQAKAAVVAIATARTFNDAGFQKRPALEGCGWNGHRGRQNPRAMLMHRSAVFSYSDGHSSTHHMGPNHRSLVLPLVLQGEGGY
jgi:hypothetical protein